MKDAPADILRAVRSGDIDTLTARLSALDGDIDGFGSNGSTLAEWAAIEGQVESLHALVAAGAKPASNEGILHKCIFSGWGEGGDVSMVEALLDLGCDPNQRKGGESGSTPLYEAAMVAPFPSRSAAATRLLLERGADPSLTRGAAQMCPLHVAASGIATETVRLLLEAGADPNVRDRRGRTPAHHCVETFGEAQAHAAGDPDDNSVEVAVQLIHDNLSMLCQHGADLSLQDEDGRTPLQDILLRKGCPESIVRLMLDAGAPTDVMTPIGDDTLDLLAMATLHEYPVDLIVRLYDAGCPTDQPYGMFGGRPWLEVATQFHPQYGEALCRHSEAFVTQLAAHRTAKGTNMLACAAVGGSQVLVDFMRSQGLSPTETNNEGMDAIAFAEGNGHDELATYLRGLA